MSSVTTEQIDIILSLWGISGKTVEHIYTSAHNSSWDVGGRFILQRQLSPDIEKLSRNILLSNLLAKENIPTIVYIKTTQGEWTSPDGAYTLTERLKGKHLDFYTSPDLMFEMGRGLAQLHAAFSHLEDELQCKEYNFITEWENYIKPGLFGVSNVIIKQTEDEISAVYEKLPRCLIHRDVHAQNVLFDNGKISGWLDFDLNRKDARIFDIAYLLAGLLVGCMEDSAKLSIWRILYQNLLDGYNDISPLTENEISILPGLMIAVELLFVAYWNSVGNDSESVKAYELAKWLSCNKVSLK